MVWGELTCSRHFCDVCLQPESRGYGKAMVHCARCPRSFHQSCLIQVEHAQSTSRTVVCGRCVENTPKGLNAPDAEVGRRRRAEAEAEAEEAAGVDDDVASSFSLAAFAKAAAKLKARKEREFSLPDEHLAALRSGEVLPSSKLGFAPPPFTPLRRSIYRHANERERLDPIDILGCSCTPTNGMCFERCSNRALQQECNASNCGCGELCGNRPFSNLGAPSKLPLQLFKTVGKGWGVKTTAFVEESQLVVEYVGEVIDADVWERRKRTLGRFEHMYFMALNGSEIVDASRKGNIARFINHSCNPNLQVQKWYVKSTPRLGFFAKRPIAPGEELSYNYSVKWSGDPEFAQPCCCGAKNCTGFLGRKPPAQR